MNKMILNNGVEMPSIGLGTYPLFGTQLSQIVLAAYDCGYRLFDTADNYYNEEDLGEALSELYNKKGNVREELFLVTKISDELYRQNDITPGMNRGVYFWKNSPYMQSVHACHEIVTNKIENSLRFLKTDYIDLLLMHRPYPDYFEEIWYEMELAYKAGKVRAIGLCNCYERHLDKLLKMGTIVPMVNQIETSPLNTKENLIEYYGSKGVRTMVYSPLQSLKFKNRKDYLQCLEKFSLKYKKNIGQILLRYYIQRNLIPIPKSTNVNRLQSNVNVFGFCMTDEDINMLSSFNVDYQYLPESKGCPGF